MRARLRDANHPSARGTHGAAASLQALELSGISARFASPVLHTYNETANFVTQVSSVREGFGRTDYAARLLGIPDEELDAVKSDEARAATDAAISAMFGGPNAGSAQVG